MVIQVLPTVAAGDTILRGLTGSATRHDARASAPTILKRTEQKFVQAVLQALSDGDLDVLLDGAIRAEPGAVLKLSQPIHRVNYVALVEIVANTFCLPRLDPSLIDSAGLVVRRVADDDDGSGTSLEGWLEDSRHVLRGWCKLSSDQESADPDAARRPAPSVGHPEIDRRLALQGFVGGPWSEPLSENVAPLFATPPAVAEATDRTIRFGVVPVTSNERSEVPPKQPDFALANVAAHLHPLLRASGGMTSPSWANQTYDPTYVPPDGASDDLNQFILMLRQLDVELDAFGTGPAAKALFDALNQVQLPFQTDASAAIEAALGALGLEITDIGGTLATVSLPAGDFLKQAASVLVERNGADQNPLPAVTMPTAWPDLTAAQADAIVQATRGALVARLPQIHPNEARFEDPARQYRLRAFVRVKRPDGCPPEIVWSDYSAPFRIAPWYETGNAPPVQIPLPDITDRDVLKGLKPNVSFVVPEKLMGMLNGNNPKDVLKGNLSPGGGAGGIAWICSFSIPIITICAFLVLNIFLSLFDLVFFWMAYVKICLPFPRKLLPKGS